MQKNEVELTKQKEETEKLLDKKQVNSGIQNQDEIEQDQERNSKKQVASQDTAEQKRSPKNQQIKRKGFMGSWIILGTLALLTFTLCNLTIAEISALGVQGMYFYNSGALVTSILYFVIQYFVKKRNKRQAGVLDAPINPTERTLLYKADGTFDAPMIPLLAGGVIVQAVILYGITISYQYSIKAGLNIGISQTIWSLTPFFTAAIDYCFYGDKLQKHHYIGMSLVVICAILVSVSSIIAGDQASNLDIPVEERVPTYVPILIAFFMPFASTAIILLSKHVCADRGVSGNDWTFGYFLIFMLILQIMSIFYYRSHEGVFSQRLYWTGFIGSSLNVIGCFFANSAFGTGGPSGPISALINTQMITVALMQIFITLKVPHWIQIIGMVLGLIGAFILTIPTHMHGLWYRMTRCVCQPHPDPYIPREK